MKEVIVSQNLDAGASAFFALQLEHVKARTYDVVYPGYMALKVIPVSTDAGSGAETISYQQFDEVGLAKVIASYADDLPRADIKGTKYTANVVSLGNSYGYSIQEIRRAQFAGLNLEQRKANAARKAHDQLANKIAWFGDADNGLQGLLYAANVTKGSVENGTWDNADADDIIEDVNLLIIGIIELTLGVEQPNTILMPVGKLALIASKARSTTDSTTILSFLKAAWPSITFYGIPELKDVNPVPSTGAASNTDVIIAYEMNPDKLTLEIPQPFEQFAAQERGLEFIVPCHSRIGGVITYYPLSISIGEGI